MPFYSIWEQIKVSSPSGMRFREGGHAEKQSGIPSSYSAIDSITKMQKGHDMRAPKMSCYETFYKETIRLATRSWVGKKPESML